MKTRLNYYCGLAATAILVIAATAPGAVQVNTALSEESSGASFTFTNVPAPARNDAATSARARILAGIVDSNSGGIGALRDGQSPAQPDQPDANFFFEAGTEGGRLLFDLERIMEVKQVNTYSRHPDSRGPQVYK